MTGRLAGKVALVTGAAGGQGRAAVRHRRRHRRGLRPQVRRRGGDAELVRDDGLVRDAAVALVAQACLEALAGATRPDVYAFGSTHAARHPEFQAPGRLAPVLALIDSPEPWEDLVTAEAPGTVTVTIGREHARPELAHLSLVGFRVEGPVGATIGLLGPRRMDYGRAIGLVDFVGRRLTSLL